MDILSYLLVSVIILLPLFSFISRMLKKRNVQFGITTLLLFTILLMLISLDLSGTKATIFQILSINPFSIFFGIVFTSGFILVNILATEYSDKYENFSLLASFALVGMYLVAASNSLITIFLGIEFATLPSVFIILLSKKSIEAAAKLFIMAAIAIAILSFAIVISYGATNTFAIPQHSNGYFLLFAAILFIASLGFEASIFPFNVLMPDVYSGSPAYITSMLGGINKKMGFAALIQVMILVLISYHELFYVIAILSILTMFYGNLVAIMQKNVKRMLAYSSISQSGYILIGIAAFGSGGISAALFQIFAHTFLFIGLLGIVAWMESKGRINIDNYIGLNSENRLAAFSITIFMLSLVGLPFTTGFIGKFLLFFSAVNGNLVFLAIFGIINSIISVYYYIRVIIATYTKRYDSRPLRMSPQLAIILLSCLAITVLLGVYPSPLLSFAKSASAYLLAL